MTTNERGPLAVEHFIFCERASVDADGKPHLVAPISRMQVTNLPGKAAEFGIYADFWGAPLSSHAIRFSIEGPPGANEYTDPGRMDATMDEAGRCGVLFGLREIIFTLAGVYTIRIHRDGVVPGDTEVLATRRFEVVQMPSPTWGTAAF